MEQLSQLIDQNEVFATGHTGFSLYELESSAYLYGYQARRYFVPASNVKLFTTYLALAELGNRVPVIYYQRFPDRIELWGAGYPLTLHQSFLGYDALSPWLQAQELPLVLNIPREDEVPRYGEGWSWDDWNYGYVYERSAVPVYGNRLRIDRRFLITPPAWAGSLVRAPNQARRLERAERENVFRINDAFYSGRGLPVERALILDPATTVRLLNDAAPVRLDRKPRPSPNRLDSIQAILPDTVYRKLLRDSDNFLAEQLLLQSAVQRYDRFDEERLLEYATDTLFTGIGLGELELVDASGLSRYNLAQPEQLTRLILALERKVGRDRLLTFLSAGGRNGTLEQRFGNRPETYLWAKTGTLSGVVCVTGLIKTRTGRWLAFSFLHNNIVERTSTYYQEMERVMAWIYDNL